MHVFVTEKDKYSELLSCKMEKTDVFKEIFVKSFSSFDVTTIAIKADNPPKKDPTDTNKSMHKQIFIITLRIFANRI